MSELTIKQLIADRLKAAMISKDKPMSELLRMLKTRMMEKMTAKDFSGEENDALWLNVIEAYLKQNQKSLEEYSLLGEQGQVHVDRLSWEISVLKTYLPAKADEATHTQWAKEAIESLGGIDVARSKSGQVMGTVMKAHKDVVDPVLLKELVAKLLA
jgi:uncharacterized protein YqeY